MYDFGGRIYMPDIVRTTTIDPMAEKFYNLSPQSFLNNNPLSFIDPTGMESEGIIDPPKNKQTAIQRAYDSKTGNTDGLKLLVNFIGDINTYVREKIELSDKDLTTTATSKKGGNENQKTTGKAGDKINADPFLDGAPGSASKGNNLSKGKDFIKAVKDVNSLFKKGQKVGEKVNEVVKENSGKSEKPADMIYLVKDDKNPSNNVQVNRADYEAQQKNKQ
jgi:hypothetical protein